MLFGWQPTTVDVDVKLIPDSDKVLRALPAIKETFHVNVELASGEEPGDLASTNQSRIRGWKASRAGAVVGIAEEVYQSGNRAGSIRRVYRPS